MVGDSVLPNATARRPPKRSRRWSILVVLATILGLSIRVAAVLTRPGLKAHGDAYFYHEEANLLVAGKGWINPFLYQAPGHEHVATASFPPLFTLVLAMASLV